MFKNWMTDDTHLLFASIVIIVLILIIRALFRYRYFYEKKTHLASRAEQRFLKQLLKIVPEDCCVHCQTSLIALLKPADFRSARMVWAKRMDYVVTDWTTKILFVIELDDKSHLREDRKKRDKFVNKALKGKHVLLRFTTEQSKDIGLVKRTVERELQRGLLE